MRNTRGQACIYDRLSVDHSLQLDNSERFAFGNRGKYKDIAVGICLFKRIVRKKSEEVYGFFKTS